VGYLVAEPFQRGELAVTAVFAVSGLFLGTFFTAVLVSVLDPVTLGGLLRAIGPTLGAGIGTAVWLVGVVLAKLGRGRILRWSGALGSILLAAGAGLILI
jgi:hypothetical protein